MVVGDDNKAAYREVTLGRHVDGLRIVTVGPEGRASASSSTACSACARARWSRRRPWRWTPRPKSRRQPDASLTPKSRSPGSRENLMNLSKFFIDRPIFAGVLSLLIFLARPDRGARRCRSPNTPRSCRPRSSCARNYPGANPKVIAETVATPLEEAINGVEDMLYMSSQATTDGLMTLTVTFKLGTDPDKAQQLVQNRVSQAEPRLPEEVRRLGVTTVKSAPDLTMVVHLLSPNEPLRHDVPAQLRGAQRQGPPRARRGRGRRAAVRLGRLLDARLARSAARSPSAASRRATWCARSASRTCRPPPASSAHRPACRASTCSSRSTRRAACRPRKSSATSS